MGEGGGGLDAHGSAAFEVAAGDQGEFREALHPVQEGGDGVGVGADNIAALDAVQQDESANANVRHQGMEFPVRGGFGIGQAAIEGDHDELGGLLLEREGGEQAVHFGGLREDGRGQQQGRGQKTGDGHRESILSVDGTPGRVHADTRGDCAIV